MKAVRFRTPGGLETLVVEELPDPRPQAEEVLIRVAGAGLDRDDSLQRLGRHNLGPGASKIFGMEISGTIVEAGSGIDGFILGDHVMALLASGGHAEYVALNAGHVLPIPRGIGLIEAAGVPEAAATLVSIIYHTGRLATAELFLSTEPQGILESLVSSSSKSSEGG
ncbi:alcohol dehydrogenase catalytic domain-containing protein [Arthrobacter sp. Z1-9]